MGSQTLEISPVVRNCRAEAYKTTCTGYVWQTGSPNTSVQCARTAPSVHRRTNACQRLITWCNALSAHMAA